ncbi:LPXTG cell wall anchor domain-containing protein [Luethyella okanaganae]|uniref:LPXTG cell wall anchor domain-containing protein n=1 Tax=Luethyella okanaganae TaxID=69372 RepID=A0ABW1VHW1_9MICO
MRLARSRLTILVALPLIFLTGTAPADATTSANLIDATPDAVTLAVPAPGESASWSMTVDNTSGRALPLRLAVSGSSNALFAGANPLLLSAVDGGGRHVYDAVPVGELLGTATELNGLNMGESYVLTGTVSLPLAAGNEYQNAGGTITLRFSTEANGPSTPLASTGAEALPLVALAVGILALGGALIVVSRNKRRASND